MNDEGERRNRCSCSARVDRDAREAILVRTKTKVRRRKTVQKGAVVRHIRTDEQEKKKSLA